MTKLIDIYVAAGGTVSEDGTQVSIPQVPQPFDIALRVIPTVLEQKLGHPDQVTFQVLLADAHIIEGQRVNWFEYDEQVTLPVDQVRIVPREEHGS